MHRCRLAVVAAHVLLLVAGLVTSGCSGGGGGSSASGSSSSTSSESGQVTLAIKDAPLNTLQTLTIDVTGARLKGAGVPDAQIYPTSGSTGALTIDLLGLQGFSQLVGAASVPAGTYWAVELDFSNPQATDFNGTPQNISTAGSLMQGLFSPPLNVVTGSSQAVQIDVDLQRSYIDLGGNDGFLAPVLIVNLLTPQQPAPIQRFAGIVQSVDPAGDSFVVDTFVYGPNPPMMGQITVQCDANTTFNDGQGGISQGNVAANLNPGDNVEIDGAMGAAGGVVNASQVLLLPPGQPGGGMPPGGMPTVIEMAGTIMDVDTTGSTITIKVDHAMGPQGSTLPQPFTDVVIPVDQNTVLHRGVTPLTLADYVQGNFCRVLVDPGSSATMDVDEFPAFVGGTINSVAAGQGPNGEDVVDFTPDIVNQVQVSQLPFVPSPLTVDVPPGSAGQAGDPFGVFAFFDGTSHMVYHGYQAPIVGPIPQPPTGGQPGGGYYMMAGSLQQGGTAVLNQSNDITFPLDVVDPMTQQHYILDVWVNQAAMLTFVDAQGNPQHIPSHADATALINQYPGYIEVEGQAGQQPNQFECNSALRIFEVPPGPGGPPQQHVLIGMAVGQATQGSNGEIFFTLDLPGNPGMPPRQVTVTVFPGALRELHTPQGIQALTVQDAIAELNNQPVNVEVEGTDLGATFDATHALRIFR